MDAQRAITVAAAFGGRVFEIDGPTNRWVVLIDREDGTLVCICSRGIREYASRTDFPDGIPLKTISISPRASGGLMPG